MPSISSTPPTIQAITGPLLSRMLEDQAREAWSALQDNWLGNFVSNVLMYGVIVVPASIVIYYVKKNPALIKSTRYKYKYSVTKTLMLRF